MKGPQKQKNKHSERSPEQKRLLALIRGKFQDVKSLQSMRKHLNGKMKETEDDKMQMYLIIAQNSLAESQSLLGSKGVAEAQKRFELAMNELRFASEIIEHYRQEAERT